MKKEALLTPNPFFSVAFLFVKGRAKCQTEVKKHVVLLKKIVTRREGQKLDTEGWTARKQVF